MRNSRKARTKRITKITIKIRRIVRNRRKVKTINRSKKMPKITKTISKIRITKITKTIKKEIIRVPVQNQTKKAHLRVKFSIFR